MFRFLTAGESHGRELLAIVEGLPAGLTVDTDLIDGELSRRQGGYGRSGRQRIEQDAAEIVAGLRHGRTIGAPVVMKIVNRDARIETLHPLASPRPGHGDLAGALKFGLRESRDILERASARETASRVMAGALARQLLAEFGIDCFGFVSEMAGISCLPKGALPAFSGLRRRRVRSEFYMLGAARDGAVKTAVNRIAGTGDTLGGVVTGVVRGVPAGLGNHGQWDRKLDGEIARAVMSIQAIKGVEIGIGFASARLPGSRVHDEIHYRAGSHPLAGGFYRKTNRAGGLEAGITNGEDLVVHAAMKPIATLRPPIRARSVNLATRRPEASTAERGDITATPAASVVLENMLALVVTGAFLEKFGGDSLRETRRNYDGYMRQLRRR